MKKSIDDIEVRGKRVLVRLDLNVPLDDQSRITDDRRITAALPTLKKIRKGGGRLVLMSHLGRPKGRPGDREKFSLAPVAVRLGELLDCPVPLVRGEVAAVEEGVAVSAGPRGLKPAAQGSKKPAAQGAGKPATWGAEASAAWPDAEVVLLENLRFHQAETIKDAQAAKDASLRTQKDAFARGLADMADVYVNDAFGTCHRDNASMLTVPQMMVGKPRVVGLLVRKELRFLGEALADPKRPFACLLGGAKVSDKLGVIQALLGRCDTILIGGAMAYTFLAAKGESVGRSLVEADLLATARSLIAEAGDRLVLPTDSVCAREMAPNAVNEVHSGGIPTDLMGLDIGPHSVEHFAKLIGSAKTVVWNGPMGVFEMPPFDRGTVAMAEALAEATDRGAVSIVGGGDSSAAVDRAGVADRLSHISTGGGASLEFLEGKPFAALEVLDDA
ncbi:MAG: phosphoglycerate kinase [Phycisphaerae bacterium]